MKFNAKKLGLVFCLFFVVMVESPADKFYTVAKVRWTQERLFDGRIEPVRQATVSSQISGRITQIHFDVHELVPEGAILVEFENRKQSAALAAATANVNEAKTQFEHARSELTRITDVFEKRLIAKSVYEKANTDLQAAQARLSQAQANHKLRLEQFDDTVIRAPFMGIVLKKHIEVGETARIGQSLLTGYALKPLRVVTPIPITLVPEVQKLQQVNVYMGLTKLKSGELTLVPISQVREYSYDLRVVLSEQSEQLFPGMLVKVGIPLGEEQILSIPATAIVKRSEVTGVYIVTEGGGYRFRHVRLGRSKNDYREVLAGLLPGEKIQLQAILIDQNR